MRREAEDQSRNEKGETENSKMEKKKLKIKYIEGEKN